MEIFTREHYLRNTGGLDPKQILEKIWLAKKNNKGRLKKWRIETRIVGKLDACCSGIKVLAMVDKNKKERILNCFSWPDVIFTSV
ncbi:MAG: hypothetical protein ABIF22_02450 [bacterium]